MIAAVAVNFANVVARYLFLRPFVWGEEIMQFMNVWAVMLGAAVVTSHGAHLRMDAFYNLAGPRLRRALEVLSNLLAMAVFLYVIYQSLQMVQMLTGTGQRSVIARVPMNVMYAAIPLGFACGFLFLTNWFLGLWRRQPAPEDDAEPSKRSELLT
jgi:TRAP-type C4-dicarboxylate transport system permease small subunit